MGAAAFDDIPEGIAGERLGYLRGVKPPSRISQRFQEPSRATGYTASSTATAWAAAFQIGARVPARPRGQSL
ncbi:unnamed protein product [Lampetra planeri]